MKNLKFRPVHPILLLLWILVASLSVLAQITPSQDSYTNSATSTTNYGAAVTLGVASTATSIQTTYIKFDLSSVPSGYSSANVAKATLKLYVNSVAHAGSFNVDYVNGSWGEKTITSSLAPTLGNTIASGVPLTTANANDYVLIDVTPAIGEWVSGSQPNDGIALVANSGLAATFDSKENTAQSHPAGLDIVFTSGGTISGVTTSGGSGLTGGGTSGTLNLSLQSCAPSQVLQWNGSAWACASVGTGAGTITGVSAGTDLVGGGNSGSVTLNLDTTKVPVLNANNSFTGNQSITGTLTVKDTSGLSGGLFDGETVGTFGSTGLTVFGGTGTTSVGGAGLMAVGGLSASGTGGIGIEVQGGNSTSLGTANGGTGIQAQGGSAIASPGVGGTGGIFTGGAGATGQGVLPAGDGLHATGAGSQTNGAGNGIIAVGGNGELSPGVGIQAIGGQVLASGFSGPGNAGTGGMFAGGQSANANIPGGYGVLAFGGNNASGLGGVGISAQGGVGANGVLGTAGRFGGDVIVQPSTGITIGLGGAEGCGTGFAALGFGTGGNDGLACTNYSLLGDGKSTWVNRPNAGYLFFLEGNTLQMMIAPGGDVTVAGNLNVNGTVAKGGGSFKIDHPLNPANQYLSHSFVESPDMMNIYNGNVVTDAAGRAEVALPDYFEALNQDFRYQLTVVGQFAQAVVEREIADNRFTIRTDKPGVKVSWQVTGVRHDAWANAHRIPVESDKPEAERGYYLSPELYGAAKEKGMAWAHHSGAMQPSIEHKVGEEASATATRP